MVSTLPEEAPVGRSWSYKHVAWFLRDIEPPAEGGFVRVVLDAHEWRELMHTRRCLGERRFQADVAAAGRELWGREYADALIVFEREDGNG